MASGKLNVAFIGAGFVNFGGGEGPWDHATRLELMSDALELVRMIAAARMVLPSARVRLSAGRSTLNREAQILCMVAGANSIFYGETLLTTPNASVNEDDALFAALASRAESAAAS